MRKDRPTLAAFLVAVVIAGLNFVAVRYSNREVPPFEGAAVRFAAASLLFFAYTRALGISLPRGRSLVGAALFGLIGFCGAYAFLYWGLIAAPAGTASVTLALVPLMTPLLATAHGLERLRARTFVGGTVAAVGIAIVAREQLAATVPLASLAALLAGALGAAESGVVVKYFPRSHPAATNAVAMACGAAALIGVSLVARESWVVPAQPATIVATAYLIASTVALFALVLYVLGRWTATAASLQFPLSPLVTVAAGAAIAGEGVSLGFLAGAVLAGIGVVVAAGIVLPLGAGRAAVAPS